MTGAVKSSGREIFIGILDMKDGNFIKALAGFLNKIISNVAKYPYRRVESTGGYFQLSYLHFNGCCMLMHCCEPLQDTFATGG